MSRGDKSIEVESRLVVAQGLVDSMDMSLSKLWETAMARGAGVLHFMGLQRLGHNLATEHSKGLKRIEWGFGK